MIVDDLVTIYRHKIVGADLVKSEMTSIEKRSLSMQRAIGYSALMAGMGFVFATKKSADLEQSIIGTATQAEISTEKMWEYYSSILSVGKSYGVAGKDMMKGFSHIVELTGDAVYGMKQLETMAKMIRGGRMAPKDAGGLLVAYRDLGKGKYDAKQILKMVNEATYIAKKGAISVGNLADMLPRALAITMNSGETDLMRGNRETVASLEMIDRLVRAPKKAVVAYENMVADISKGDKLDAFNLEHGTDIKKNEGVLNIMEKMVTALAKAKDLGGMAELMGLKKDDMRGINQLGQFMEVYGRRGSRGAVGVGSNLSYARQIIEEAKLAGDVITDDTEQWSGSATVALAKLATTFEEVTKKITESGGLASAIKTLNKIFESLIWYLGDIPKWLVNVILFVAFMKTVVLRLAFVLLDMLLPTFATLLVLAKESIIEFGLVTGVTKIWTLAVYELNRAMMANPILFWATVILMILPLIIKLYHWLAKLFGWGGKKTIDVNKTETSNVAGLNPEKFTAPNGGGFSGRQVNIATNVNIDNVSNEGHVDDIAEAIERNNRVAYKLA